MIKLFGYSCSNFGFVLFKALTDNALITSKKIQSLKLKYHKVANSSLPRLVAHFQIFRRLMKGKFDAYVL